MKNILIISDDRSHIDVMESFLLKSFPVNVATSHNRSEALAILDKNRFDLIIEDVLTPGINWEVLMLKVGKTAPETQFIVMTPELTPALVHRIESHGGWVLERPFGMKVLDLLVARCLKK